MGKMGFGISWRRWLKGCFQQVSPSGLVTGNTVRVADHPPRARRGATSEQTSALPVFCLRTRRNGAIPLGSVTFEWDARKAAANFKRHGVTFEDGSSVFFDPLAITFPDPDHSLDERREVTLGYTMKKEMVFVSHCERGERVRIISVRLATRTERRQYEEGIGS